MLFFLSEKLKTNFVKVFLKNSVFSKLKVIVSNVVPHFLHLVTEEEIQQKDDEWIMLRNLNFSGFDLTGNNDVVEFWQKVSKI